MSGRGSDGVLETTPHLGGAIRAVLARTLYMGIRGPGKEGVSGPLLMFAVQGIDFEQGHHVWAYAGGEKGGVSITTPFVRGQGRRFLEPRHIWTMWAGKGRSSRDPTACCMQDEEFQQGRHI